MHPRSLPTSDEGATLQFQRHLPICADCPYRHVPSDSHGSSSWPGPPVLPTLPLDRHGSTFLPGPPRPGPAVLPAQLGGSGSAVLPTPLSNSGSTVLPVPSINGPGVAALPTPPLPGSLTPPDPNTAKPTTALRSHPASLPRPSLLALVEAHGSGTLVLPDALKPAGPDAETVARPVDPTAPSGPGGRGAATRIDAGRPEFDEMASPDITVMQQATPSARPAPPRRPARATPDARAYFVLNLCLGILIVAGLAILVTREISPAPGLPSGGDHATR